MMQKDLFDNIAAKPVIAPVVVSDNTAQVGSIIDHNGYNSCTYLISTGTLADADATFAVLLEHGDQSNLSDAATVVIPDLLGTLAGAGFIFSDDGIVRKLGYKGGKRYSRLTITPTNNSGSAPISALCLLGSPKKAPLTTQ